MISRITFFGGAFSQGVGMHREFYLRFVSGGRRLWHAALADLSFPKIDKIVNRQPPTLTPRLLPLGLDCLSGGGLFEKDGRGSFTPYKTLCIIVVHAFTPRRYQSSNRPGDAGV